MVAATPGANGACASPQPILPSESTIFTKHVSKYVEYSARTVEDQRYANSPSCNFEGDPAEPVADFKSRGSRTAIAFKETMTGGEVTDMNASMILFKGPRQQ